MIDLIIIVIYLIAVLCIGFYVGKGNKSGIKDYPVGDRKFSTPILVISMLATFIGAGRTIGDVAEVYSVGMWYGTVENLFENFFYDQKKTIWHFLHI